MPSVDVLDLSLKKVGTLQLSDDVFGEVGSSHVVWEVVRHYLAARLGVLTFLTPLFGVLGGALLLGEPLTPAFFAAALLVGSGIFLVNLKS